MKAYDTLFEIVGQHTKYKVVVYAFHKGHPLGRGSTNTDRCTINYNDENLTNLKSNPEWTHYEKPHVSGYIEEMAHNFVSATEAVFGWEMLGWSISVEATNKVAGNPYLSGLHILTREGQEETFKQYLKDGFVFPANIAPNLCDRIHALLLYEASSGYGSKFWPDFFREIKKRRQG